MDFEYTPEQEAFRMEVREWLRANLPPELCVDDAMDERIAASREIFEKRRQWQIKVHDAGYVGLAWPKEYGGRAAPVDGTDHLRRGILAARARRCCRAIRRSSCSARP